MAHTGSCLCGDVRYTAVLKSTSLGACHCGMCRRWTGSAMIGAPVESIEFVADDTLAVYASSEWAERGFCQRCGSCLFYRFTLEGPSRGDLHLAAGTLDELDGLALAHEVFTDARPDAWAFAGDLPGMTEAEIRARYGS